MGDRGSGARAGQWMRYGWAVLTLAVCTASGSVVVRVLSVTDVAMLYLIGVGLVAARQGRGPSLFAAILSIALFDFFFVPPRFTFAVSEARYLLTFGVMLGSAVAISALTHRLREQGEAARDREQRTGALYAMSRELAVTRGVTELAAVACRHVGEMFGAQAVLLLRAPGGDLVPATGGGDAAVLGEKERGVARWVFDHWEPAGLGTERFSESAALFVPLVASGGRIGVLGLSGNPRLFADAATQRQLETFAGLAGQAVERAQLAERAQREQLEAEAERLRTSLLSSLSHDLRTPLGVITGSASSLLEAGGGLSDLARRDLAETILEESRRMNRLIGNLLDMIRVESGTLNVQRDWQPLEETVGMALIRLEDRLRAHPVTVHLAPDLPLVPVDSVLMEQVFVNLLENAIKYTPPGTPIEISAAAVPGAIEVTVADRGPGLPPGEERRIFDKFYRGPAGSTAGGVGLGLAICRGIIVAHGGEIDAATRAGGGSAFRFTLPLLGSPPADIPAEAPAV